jgi:hypothetical protein
MVTFQSMHHCSIDLQVHSFFLFTVAYFSHKSTDLNTAMSRVAAGVCSLLIIDQTWHIMKFSEQKKQASAQFHMEHCLRVYFRLKLNPSGSFLCPYPPQGSGLGCLSRHWKPFTASAAKASHL